MADNSGAVDLSKLSSQDQESVKKMAGEQPDEKPTVLTAFAIVVGPDGNPQVVSYENDDFQIQTAPTPDLVYGACATVIKDLEAQETAQASAHATAQVMMAQARAIAEQQQGAAVAQQLGDLRT